MSKLFTRTILFAGIACILLAALPAAAGQVSQAQPAAPCKLDVPALFASPTPAVAAPALPEWLAGGISSASSHKFHGFCPCGCSSVPNCNTNADCGGGTCGQFISCC